MQPHNPPPLGDGNPRVPTDSELRSRILFELWTSKDSRDGRRWSLTMADGDEEGDPLDSGGEVEGRTVSASVTYSGVSMYQDTPYYSFVPETIRHEMVRTLVMGRLYTSRTCVLARTVSTRFTNILRCSGSELLNLWCYGK